MGMLAQVGYLLPFAPWIEPVYRFEMYDPHEGRLQNKDELQARMLNTAGVNLYLSQKHVWLMVDYILTDMREGVKVSPEGNVLIGDAVKIQLQVSF